MSTVCHDDWRPVRRASDTYVRELKRKHELEVKRLVAERDELLEAAEDFLLDYRNGLGPDPERLAALVLKIRGE